MNRFKQKNKNNDSKEFWHIFLIVMIPVAAAMMFSLYVTQKCKNIKVTDIDYLQQVKLILATNIGSFLTASLCFALIFSHLIHFLWNPDRLIQKKFYNKAQMRFYRIESIVIVTILMIPSMILINCSKKFNLDYYSAFDQIKILVDINKNIKGESEIKEELFDSAPYFSWHPTNGKEVGTAVPFLTSIGKPSDNERLIIPYSEENDTFAKNRKSSFKITYFEDTNIVASIEEIDTFEELNIQITLEEWERYGKKYIGICKPESPHLQVESKLFWFITKNGEFYKCNEAWNDRQHKFSEL